MRVVTLCSPIPSPAARNWEAEHPPSSSREIISA